MATISEAFAMALEHQRSGRMVAAEHIYRQILQAEPNHANALRMLGVLAHRVGRHDEALQLIGQAIKGAPDDASKAACYSSLSEILRVMGRVDEAVAAGRMAIQLQPSSVAGHFNVGNALRARGRLDEAIAAYQRAVELKPDFIDAHINLGNSFRDSGRIEEGAECFQRALQIDEGSGAAHFNLGVTRKLQGKPAEAAACFRRTAELRPDFAGAYNNLGAALQDLGRLDEAAASFRRALEVSPDFAGVHNNLGAVLKDLGKLEEAAACFQRAIALEPRGAETYNSLGLVYKDLGRLAEAAASFRRATELEPSLAEAHNNLGNALRHGRKLEEAAVCYARALELKPDFARVYHNLGILYRDEGKLEEAMVSCRRALELAPDLPGPHNTIGVALMDQGKLEEAVTCYRRALELESRSSEAGINLSAALFLLGRYEEAWGWYETRLALAPPRAHSTPRWNQAPMEGQTLFLHCEQGLGDTLQFLRYARLAREQARAGRVILECQRPVARLLAASVGDELEIVARTGGAVAPVHDWHLPLLSLPLALRIFEPLPMSRPYLRADLELRAVWKERLEPKVGFRVGVVWKGNPAHEQDRTRSIVWEKFVSLLNVPGVCYYSLQVGASESEAAALAEAGIIDWTAQLGDFSDTAAFVAELDLIISVDTAVAHLAGAMSRPVWTLLPFVPDWRWGGEGESTAWYSTMRLFRQPRPWDWEAVVGRVREELERQMTNDE